LPFRIIKITGYQQNADSCPVVFSGRMAVCTLKNKRFLLGADFKHLGAACRAHTLGSRAAVLHGDGLGIFHFLLGAAFNTITLHLNPP